MSSGECAYSLSTLVEPGVGIGAAPSRSGVGAGVRSSSSIWEPVLEEQVTGRVGLIVLNFNDCEGKELR